MTEVVIEVKDNVPCRFPHSETAVARFKTPGGCACYPHDAEQDLCAQHAIKSEALAGIWPIVIYDPETWKLIDNLF